MHFFEKFGKIFAKFCKFFEKSAFSPMFLALLMHFLAFFRKK